MVVPDSLFDALLFGLLLVAVLLDFFLPQVFHGVATALVVAAFSYSAAQDLAFGLSKRRVWSQESLPTSVALCALGALFYFRHNQADIVLVVLSIGLMMASLMSLIALVACVGACLHERSASPVAGLLLTVFGALALGIGAGLLTLVLVAAPLPLRLGVVAVGVVAWKLRGFLGRQSPKTTSVSNPNLASNSPAFSANSADTSSTRIDETHVQTHKNWLSPQGGTVLDRIVPLIVIGALAFAVLTQMQRGLFEPTSAAQATSSQSQNTSPAQAPISP